MVVTNLYHLQPLSEARRSLMCLQNWKCVYRTGTVSTDLDLELCLHIRFSESLAITTQSYCTRGHLTIRSKITTNYNTNTKFCFLYWLMKERNCTVKSSIKKYIILVTNTVASLQYSTITHWIKSKDYSFANVKIFLITWKSRATPHQPIKKILADLQLLTYGCLSFRGVKLSSNYWA